MIFDTISALADYRNNLKFDNNATREQCEAVVLELSRAQHETLTVGQKRLLNNEIDKYSYWVDGIQHKTSRTELEPYVSNESSSSSMSAASNSSSSSSETIQSDLLFLKVDDGVLTDSVGKKSFTCTPSATLEQDYVNSVSTGYIESLGNLSIVGEEFTYGLWMRRDVMSSNDDVIELLTYAGKWGSPLILSYVGIQDENGADFSQPKMTVGEDEWNFVVAQYSNSQRTLKCGKNGVWVTVDTEIPPQYIIRKYTIPLLHIIKFFGPSGGSINGLFITESYPDWTVLREYALASKPADAVMW